MKTSATLLALASLVVAVSPLSAADPFPPLAPAEFLKTVQLPEGYKLEPVLTEPDIKEPVVAAFDGNGRIFVAEMRTYMQDIDATDEDKPVSRVSLHWSSKGDGKFDKHTVFVDKLLLPRMILPLGRGELLINESHTQDIYLYRDTNGDGVADEEALVRGWSARRQHGAPAERPHLDAG